MAMSAVSVMRAASRRLPRLGMLQRASMCSAPTQMTVRDALNSAIYDEMKRDESVFVIGEEVAQYQGAYKVTKGLFAKYVGLPPLLLFLLRRRHRGNPRQPPGGRCRRRRLGRPVPSRSRPKEGVGMSTAAVGEGR